MKTTKEHYKLFVSECQRLVILWGLNDWKIYYEYGKSEGNRGKLWTNGEYHIATIQLAADWETEVVTEQGIKSCARHEVIHLLFAYLVYIAECRFCTDTELYTEKERLVRHLQSILFPEEGGLCEISPFQETL